MVSRRFVLTGAIGVAGDLCLNRGAAAAKASPGRSYAARVVDLVQASMVIDMLGLLTLDYARLHQWHADPTSFTANDLSRLQASGITLFHPAVGLSTEIPYEETHTWLTGWNRFLSAHPKHFLRVETPADVTRLKSSGKIGVLLGMQNSHHFRSAQDVDTFFALGQRVSQLTYNSDNALGSGCLQGHDWGLTGQGAAIIQRMNQVGMAVDVSHCGTRTTLDAFSASRKPVLITHSNCQALVPGHPRCKPDEVLRAMATQGGVVGITGIRNFVGPRSSATLEHMLDHFDHAIRVAGVEHVGIGSDLDLERPSLPGMSAPQRIYDVTDGLLRRGYTDQHLRMLLGGNFQRVLAQVLPGGSREAVTTQTLVSR